MKTVTILKVTISKMQKEGKENIISARVVFLSQSLTPCHLKFQRYISPMDPFTWANKRMGQGKAPEKQLTSMAAFMMDSGSQIRKMETVNSNTLMKLSISESGRKIWEKDMEPINTQMEIDMKVIGTMIYKTVLELTTIQMETYTRESGQTENHTEKETTFIMEIREYTRETGRMAKNKGSENL